MKRLLLPTLVAMTALFAKAEGYHYLTFEMMDGQKASVPSSELFITFNDGKLSVGNKTFKVVNLMKMYFTSEDATTGISGITQEALEEATEVYDLNGKRIAKSEMRKGVYIIKGKDETYKMTVR